MVSTYQYFSEIIFIVILVILLFGGKKIPELMRGLGKGVRSFKEGMNGLDNDSSEKNEKSNSNPINDDESKK